MFLNHYIPVCWLRRYIVLYSIFLLSVMLIWLSATLFFQLLRNHIPVDTSLLALYMNPRWGEHKVNRPCILSWYLSRWGKAALTIRPPRLWAMKVSRPSWDPGHDSLMYWWTSSANFLPISNMSMSESFSLAWAHKNNASGRAIDITFLKTLTSKELP